MDARQADFGRHHSQVNGILMHTMRNVIGKLDPQTYQDLILEAARVNGDTMRAVIGELPCGMQTIEDNFARWLLDHGVADGKKSAQNLARNFCNASVAHWTPNFGR